MAKHTVAAGVDALIVHARKAWLEGLSPKENRDIPPLDYGRVYRLKLAYPDVPIVINGGIATMAAASEHLTHVDGVMLGRAAYQNPELLRAVDPLLFGEAAPVADSFAAVDAFVPYVAARLREGVRLHSMTRHLLGLFAGMPGARAYRRYLATCAVRPGAGVEVIGEALDHVRGAIAAAA
jgi:tRNA-dihydrouridine synthase A